MRQRLAVDDRRRREAAATGSTTTASAPGGRGCLGRRGITRLKRVDQLLHRQLLQIIDLIRLQPEPRHERRRIVRRDARRHARHGRSALRDGAMEQALGSRHPEQRADFSRAARLTEDRDVRRIAAEARNVVAYPLEARDDVFHPDVGCLAVLLAAERREMQEAERVQPVRDADDDDVVFAGEIGAVVRNHAGRSGAVAAAVQPHHHRPLSGGVEARRPHVQIEAVFPHRLAQVERSPFGHEHRVDERRSVAELERVGDAGPRLRLRRRQKTPRARGRGAVRDAAKRVNFVDEQPADFSGRRRDGRARRAPRRLRERARERAVETHARRRNRSRADERSSIHHAPPSGD